VQPNPVPFRLPRPDAICLILMFAVALGELALGRMRPWVTPDTASYLSVAACPACLAGPRFPLYGWIVNGVARLAGGYGPIPWIQFLAYAAAALHLMRRLPRPLFGPRASLAIGIALACSNVLLIWVSALVPFLPAIAALLAMLAELVALAGGESPTGIGTILRYAFFQALAWLFWPGVLPIVLIAPLLAFVLPAERTRAVRMRIAAILLLAGAVPLVGVAGLRAWTVGDPNISSFGGFQMSGMAALMLSPDVITRLPNDDQPLAASILAARTTLEASGAAIATPLNSTGQRSFVSEAVGYFDILARTHDVVLYDAVMPRQAPDESWIAFNHRLQKLAIDTVFADKLAYAAWIVGALCRTAGHVAITNPAFLLPGLFLLGILAFRGWRLPAAQEDPSALFKLVIWVTGGILVLPIMTTFPALRYLDAAGLLLPTLPIYVLLGQVGIRRS
jgi:hypothetical protein